MTIPYRSHQSLLILFVLSVFLSGLGYDPLSHLLPGVAPSMLPGLLLAALTLTLMRAIASIQQQGQQSHSELLHTLKTETDTNAARFDELQRRLHRYRSLEQREHRLHQLWEQSHNLTVQHQRAPLYFQACPLQDSG